MKKTGVILFCICIGVLTKINAQFLHFEQGSWQENLYFLTPNNSVYFTTSLNEHIFYKTQKSGIHISPSDQLKFNNDYLNTDLTEYNNPDTKNKIYKLKNHFYQYSNAGGRISIDPVLSTQFASGVKNSGLFQQNGRGVMVQGAIRNKAGDPKLSFRTRVLECQTYQPNFVKMYADSFGALPGFGWWKPFKKTGSDFVYATGYVNMALLNDLTEKTHIVMQLGHEAQQIGPGYRSVILGGMNNPFSYLRINTQIGIFKYQNLYGSLNGFLPLTGNTLLPKKYLSAHRGELSLGKKKNLQVGFNEMIIHSRQGGYGGFDPEYFNPIIFYRSIEANLGSADNAFMSLDANWQIKGMHLYGQFLLDEFKLSYVKSGNWWGNKSGYQFGVLLTPELLKIRGLLCRIEYNSVRPYTYSHYDVLNSYAHYNQALAHPLESNFREGIVKLDYIPTENSKWRFAFIGMYAVKGFDSSVTTGNFGSNLRRDNDTRIKDFDVNLLQGVKGNIYNVVFETHYMFMHNFMLYAKLQYRKQTQYFKSEDKLIFLGLKINFDRVEVVY